MWYSEPVSIANMHCKLGFATADSAWLPGNV